MLTASLNLARPVGRALEFLHLGLTAKYQLTIALAPLRERGTAVGEGFAGFCTKKRTLHPRLSRTLSPRRGPLSTAVPQSIQMYKLGRRLSATESGI